MPTIDEILDAMPDEVAETGREYLTIDPLSRTITVPESERVFAVTGDEYADRKYFRCPRIVGDGLDLAAMFLRVNYRNAGGDEDGYLVKDVAVSGDYVTFSWLLYPKVAEYMGNVQFGVCADLPDTEDRKMPDWNTFLATGEVLEGMHPYDGEVEQETTDVVTQLRAMVEAQTGAVEAVGAEKVQEVQEAANAAQEAAVAAVQAQGEATRASIPADYTALAATVDRLTRDRAAAIVCEAQGAAIQVQDASADPLQGLRIFGRSTQDGSPTPDNPVEIVSLAAPVVRVCGGNLFDSATLAGQSVQSIHGNIPIKLPKGTYTARVVISGNVTEKDATLVFYNAAKEKVQEVNTRKDSVFTLSGDVESVNIYPFSGAVGGTWETVIINAGTVELPWEPYKEPKALAITTPGSLPGIPVESGGNYTDENGQQWIADEVDLARGVYVQRVSSVVIDGSIAPASFAVGNKGGSVIAYAYDALNINISRNRDPKMCDRLQRSADIFPASYKDCAPGEWGYNTIGSSDMFVVMNAGNFGAAAEAQAWLRENPVTFAYILGAPVEMQLTDAELQAYRALHSVKPTTTVLTDTGAHMALEYAADPKTYIDNKLAALVAAATN